MAYFKDAAELYECLGGLFREMSGNAGIGPQIAASKLVITFVYHEPEAQITVDAASPQPAGRYFAVIEGSTDLKPAVRMTMKADVAHRFWFGKVNLVAAFAKGEIRPEGPITTVLKLLPVIKPVYSYYPEYLKRIGKSDKLI